jgi:hypothetical protein
MSADTVEWLLTMAAAVLIGVVAVVIAYSM